MAFKVLRTYVKRFYNLNCTKERKILKRILLISINKLQKQGRSPYNERKKPNNETVVLFTMQSAAQLLINHITYHEIIINLSGCGTLLYYHSQVLRFPGTQNSRYVLERTDSATYPTRSRTG